MAASLAVFRMLPIASCLSIACTVWGKRQLKVREGLDMQLIWGGVMCLQLPLSLLTLVHLGPFLCGGLAWREPPTRRPRVSAVLQGGRRSQANQSRAQSWTYATHLSFHAVHCVSERYAFTGKPCSPLGPDHNKLDTNGGLIHIHSMSALIHTCSSDSTSICSTTACLIPCGTPPTC